jgi:hypothetical protein
MMNLAIASTADRQLSRRVTAGVLLTAIVLGLIVLYRSNH